MKTMSRSPVETQLSPPAHAPRLIWDWPVRISHWLMALSFVGAYLTAESERWRLVHVTLGYTVLGLMAFRLVWGLIGSDTARFTAFVRGPSAVLRYLRSLLSARPEHHVGHNPAGAWAIVGLLALGLATTLSGWVLYEDLAGAWVEDLHEQVANAMLGLVLIHVAGVLLSSVRHRENLVASMIHGYKPAPAARALPNAAAALGVVILVAVLGFWAWQALAPGGAAAVSANSARAAGGDGGDDD